MASKPTPQLSGLDIFVDMYRMNSEIDALGIMTVHRSIIADPSRGLRRTQCVERWTRQEQIGHGGFGIVYLQKNTADEVRAVKVLDKKFNASQKQDLLRELMHMAYFSKDQACFPTFHGWYEDEEKMYLAMEYFEFGDLNSCLSQAGSAALPEEEVRRITFQVAEAVAMLHSKGISHRDIKPTNVFVYRKGPNWWVKLGDFGISKRIHGHDTASHTQYIGPFVAPEVSEFFSANDEDFGTYTNAIDIWSLGCLAYWLLTSQIPFKEKGSLRKYCAGHIDLPAGLTTMNVSADGLDFMRRCLAVQPNRRYTAQEALGSVWLYTITEEEQLHKQLTMANVTNMHPIISSSENIPFQEVNEAPAPRANLGLAPNENVQRTEPTLDSSTNGDAGHSTPGARSGVVDLSISQQTQANIEGLGHQNAGQDLVKISVARDTSKVAFAPRYSYRQRMLAMSNLHRAGMLVSSTAALAWALEEGQLCLLPHLVDAMEDINNLDESSDSLYQCGALESLVLKDDLFSLEALKYLLEKGIDPNSGSTQIPPPTAAVKHGNISMVRLLPAWRADVDIVRQPLDFRTPLQIAVLNEDRDTAAVLLEAGANTKITGLYRCTPLVQAVQNGWVDMIRLLPAAGARASATDQNNWTPLMLSARNDSSRLLNLLLQNVEDPEDESSALQLVADNGHADIVRLLLVAGADVDAQALGSPATALHLAAAAGHAPVVKALLKHGAKTRVEDRHGYYPLHYARINQHQAVEVLLLVADPWTFM